MLRLGELRHINKLRYWSLDAVLHDKYLFRKPEADAIASFLTPMLRLHPDRRAKASELVYHNWLDSVVVQGEIDAIRRAEDDEARRKDILADNWSGPGTTTGSGARHGHRRRVSAVEQSEQDAMKPVEDVVFGDRLHSMSPPPAAHTHPHPHGPPKLAAAPVPSSSGAKENVGPGRTGHGPRPSLDTSKSSSGTARPLGHA